MRIAVISDTHDLLRPEVLEALQEKIRYSLYSSTAGVSASFMSKRAAG